MVASENNFLKMFHFLLYMSLLTANIPTSIIIKYLYIVPVIRRIGYYLVMHFGNLISCSHTFCVVDVFDEL